MSTNLNFIKLLDMYDKVQVPIIQRDYAQGRKSGKAPQIRATFIDALYKFLTTRNDNFHLDFIYGLTKDQLFMPLDGQQRLTTLFLLHWYLGKKDGVQDLNFLGKFTYETRISSREFCKFLVGLPYDCICKPSLFIKDQNRYTHEWRLDPTVSAMIIMLDAIHDKFYNSNGLYKKLNLIEFSFPTEELGLTEDIYIKMNSRGKELTSFENFKASFESSLCEFDAVQGTTFGEEFSEKIDGIWCDLFWEYKEDDDISKPFLRYFLYVTEMLYFEFFAKEETTNPFLSINTKNIGENGNKTLEFEKYIKTVFFNINQIEDSKIAISTLFNSLDDLYNLKLDDSYNLELEETSNIRAGIYKFFKQIFYNEKSYEINDELTKINIFRGSDVDIDFLSAIIGSDSNNSQAFKLLFYSIIKSRFVLDTQNYRIIRNLVINDENMVRAEHMYEQINSINLILNNDKIDQLNLSGFNKDHIIEEQFKEQAETLYPQYIPLFIEMENHDYFWGSIRAVFNVFMDKETDSFVEPIPLLKKDHSEELRQIFVRTQELLGEDMVELWGELLIHDTVYNFNNNRLNHMYKNKLYNSEYEISSYNSLARSFWNSNLTKEEFLINRVRQFVQQNIPLYALKEPKKQIYVMYLLHTYIEKKDYNDFFQGNFQFGIYTLEDLSWVDKGSEIEKSLNSSPFMYKTAIQLFSTYWRGGQAILRQPSIEELEQLEQL